MGLLLDFQIKKNILIFAICFLTFRVTLGINEWCPPVNALEWCELPGDGVGLTTACSPNQRILSNCIDLESVGVSSYRSYRHAIGSIDEFKKISSKPEPPKLEIQVITDIDDTVKSSGGVKLAGVALGGIDVQYKRGMFYPGVFQFQYELARANRHQHKPNTKPLPVAVLTARAKEFKFALELKEEHPVCKGFQCVAEKDDTNWGIGPVLYGSVREWVLQNLKGERKFSNFQILHEQHEQARQGKDRSMVKYVFVGDTGEMDQAAGEQMIQAYPDRMMALFMHVVSEEKQVKELPEDKEIQGVPVLFFRTYVGAARKALQHGILDSRAVHRIIRGAEEDLRNTGVPSYSTKWKDLKKDISQTRQLVTRRALEENTLKVVRTAEKW
eukprot:CAMPEP_0117755782 /NCGR_PEP_ID=MMETSP0947-20121206/13657_1 /TAXON_ID=44440 /ORGANISM="Chattonella subsalsa, Strain CCMP2191" /LENGTH=384 /DNA_ID=CAMNT_0005575183 /DNA_START=288 /DNA_END=1439 /DNA_ORIENTATION=+